MTNIERKALELVNAVRTERGVGHWSNTSSKHDDTIEALCRAIEQHEAFKIEVSDAVLAFMVDKPGLSGAGITRFIIAEPDPLVEVINEVIYEQPNGDIDEARMANQLRAALAKRGGRIVFDD